MKDDFEKNYKEASAAEEKAQKDHVALLAEKAEEKHNSEEELKMLKEATARRDYEKNRAETEIEALEDQNTIDEGTIEKLEAALKTKTEEWQERSQVRQDELTALSKATAILNDPEQTDKFRKAYSSADSFLQEGSLSSRDVRISASQALNKAGHVSGNVQVLALAAKLSSSGADFTKVFEEIDKMVKDIDVDGNATVEFEEFLALMCGKMSCADPRDELLKTFSTICDGGSKISAADLARMAKELGETMTEEDLQEFREIFNLVDTDRGGSIGTEELRRLRARELAQLREIAVAEA